MNYPVLKAEIEKPEYAGKTDEEIAVILNGPNLPNPVTQPMVRRPLVKSETVALLSPQSAKNVLRFPNLNLVFAAFDNQDHESATTWSYSLWMSEEITEAERDACIEFINTLVLDPEWKPLVSWLEIDPESGRTLDYADIARARAEG